MEIPKTQDDLMALANDMVRTPEDFNKLHPELQGWLIETQFGWSLKHPLVFHVGLVLASHANAQFQAKTEHLTEYTKAGDYKRAIWLYEKPYRLDILRSWWEDERFSVEEFRKLLPSVWTTGELPFLNGIEKVLEMFQWAHAQGGTIFDHELGATWHNPWPQPVWRGVTAEEVEDGEYGISWTARKPLAEWFARRSAAMFDSKPVLLSGYVKDRKNILAFLADREEDEIVVSPADVTITDRRDLTISL